MDSLKDNKFILVAGGVMLLWWSRDLLVKIPRFFFGLLCYLCQEEVLRREAEKKHRQKGTKEKPGRVDG